MPIKLIPKRDFTVEPAKNLEIGRYIVKFPGGLYGIVNAVDLPNQRIESTDCAGDELFWGVSLRESTHPFGEDNMIGSAQIYNSLTSGRNFQTRYGDAWARIAEVAHAQMARELEKRLKLDSEKIKIEGNVDQGVLRTKGLPNLPYELAFFKKVTPFEVAEIVIRGRKKLVYASGITKLQDRATGPSYLVSICEENPEKTTLTPLKDIIFYRTVERLPT